MTISSIGSQQLLEKMQAMVKQAEPNSLQLNEADKSASNSLNNVLNIVNEQQLDAKNLQNEFAVSHSDITLAQVMAANQKASLVFEETLYFRNSVIKAYQDIMNMPI